MTSPNQGSFVEKIQTVVTGAQIDIFVAPIQYIFVYPFPISIPY
jgi:hypothetical protein